MMIEDLLVKRKMTKGRQQFIVYRVNCDDGSHRCAGDSLTKKLGLIHSVQFQTAQKFRIFLVIQTGFYDVAALGCVVGYGHSRKLLS